MRYPGDYLYCILHSPVPMLTMMWIMACVFCGIKFWKKKTTAARKEQP